MSHSVNREYERLLRAYGHVGRYIPNRVRFLDYEFYVPDVPSFLDQFKEIFVEKNQDFTPNGPRPLIYDCGANIGMSCLNFKLLFPDSRIVAYEADPKLAEMLRANLRENGLDGIEIHNKAVWIDTGVVPFTSEGADGGSLYLYGTWPRILVESVRLRDVLEGEERVDLLKMDIEGPEVEVIRDCREVLAKIDHIYVEYHSWARKEQELDELVSLFKESGYRYYLQTACHRQSPFINHKPDDEVIINAGSDEYMDLQLNAFAYRFTSG